MANRLYTSSRPDRWTQPRPYSDASLRRAMHGPILPMEEQSLIERILRFF